MLRAAYERLLLFLLLAARLAFVMQGVAFACAAAAAAVADATVELPAWAQAIFQSALLISGTFFVAGVLLAVERRWVVARTRSREQLSWPWPWLLGLTLLLLPAAAVIASSDLPALWHQIASQLDAMKFWDGVRAPGQFGGVVLLPVFLALLVPALVSAAAILAVAFPLAMIPLLVARSRLFPTLLAMGATCEAALVVNGWLASGALGQIVGAVTPSMLGSGDAEVLRVAADLTGEVSVLSRTSAGLGVPLLGLFLWFVFLRPSGGPAGYFGDDDVMGQGVAVGAGLVAPATMPPTAPFIGHAASRAVAKPAANGPQPVRLALANVAGYALMALGVLLVMFGLADRLRTRAVYVTSRPAPGAMAPPGLSSVRATFGARLDPASSLSVTQLVDATSEAWPRDITVTRRLAPDDPLGRTLESVATPLGPGLYRVSWRALPAGGGMARHGTFSFGIGMAVPADTASDTHSLQERDVGARRGRQVLVGGVLLLILGLLVRVSQGSLAVF